MIIRTEITEERYKKITAMMVGGAQDGWIFIEGEIPETIEGYAWLGGIRYDSEKKAIVEWKEDPLPEPIDEFAELAKRVTELERRLETFSAVK